MSDRDKEVRKSSITSRIGFAFAALMCAMAAALHLKNWLRGAIFNLPVAASMCGLAILMSISALDLPRGTLRASLAAIALLLVFGGFIAQIVPYFLR